MCLPGAVQLGTAALGASHLVLLPLPNNRRDEGPGDDGCRHGVVADTDV